jgi:hypothetical protein
MPGKLTIEEVKERLYGLYGDVVTLDVSTYKNTSTKARFIDRDYGEFWGSLNNVLAEKNSHKKRRYNKMAKTRMTSVLGIQKNIDKAQEAISESLLNESQENDWWTINVMLHIIEEQIHNLDKLEFTSLYD